MQRVRRRRFVLQLIFYFVLQERRALVFCQQDRAILCRECDISIHEANEHTQKHSRFLLTGVKLSSTCFSYQTSSSSNGCDAAMDVKTGSSHACSKRPKTATKEISSFRSAEKAAPSTSNYKAEDGQASDGGSLSTSSISEYLETLPGWCVDEFLDPSAAAAANRFCKVCSTPSVLSESTFMNFLIRFRFLLLLLLLSF